MNIRDTQSTNCLDLQNPLKLSPSIHTEQFVKRTSTIFNNITSWIPFLQNIAKCMQLFYTFFLVSLRALLQNTQHTIHVESKHSNLKKKILRIHILQIKYVKYLEYIQEYLNTQNTCKLHKILKYFLDFKVLFSNKQYF